MNYVGVLRHRNEIIAKYVLTIQNTKLQPIKEVSYVSVRWLKRKRNQRSMQQGSSQKLNMYRKRVGCGKWVGLLARIVLGNFLVWGKHLSFPWLGIKCSTPLKWNAMLSKVLKDVTVVLVLGEKSRRNHHGELRAG